MAKKEELVDLKPEKINEQQLAALQSTIKTIDQLTEQIRLVQTKFGQLLLQQHLTFKRLRQMLEH